MCRTKWVAPDEDCDAEPRSYFQHEADGSGVRRAVVFPAHRRWQHLNEAGGKRSIALTRWKTHIQDHWGDLRIEERHTDETTL